MSTATLRPQLAISERYHAARQRTLALCAPLTPEDMMVQSCPEASPAKWHLAHTAWFFESFILREFLAGYRVFRDEFTWLFNSYYRSYAEFPEKKLRSSFSRPGLEEVLRYREHVDEGVARVLEVNPDAEVLRRVELGVNHEEQHQELLLTDMLNAFFTNPLRPAYVSAGPCCADERRVSALSHVEHSGGLVEAGMSGAGFCYDNELPRHRVWLEPYAVSDRLVTNEEFAGFMADGGYERPELWLSAGWDAVERNGWKAPLYWSKRDGEWSLFTLRGEMTLKQMAAAPVSHVSYYEADAYARWAGGRLLTEYEWEAAAEGEQVCGNLMDSGMLMPAPAESCVQESATDGGVRQLFGDCWEWTASAYLGYPGFEPLGGSLGEYNGKFMSGQMVLRGGSCATPQAHIRATYRNFFPPETRWQFSGIRLARK